MWPAMDRVNEVKKGEDAAAINQAVDELQRASQAMAEHLYASSSRNAGAGPGPGAAGPGGPQGHGEAPGGGAPKPDDVIDVEFEEKK